MKAYSTKKNQCKKLGPMDEHRLGPEMQYETSSDHWFSDIIQLNQQPVPRAVPLLVGDKSP